MKGIEPIPARDPGSRLPEGWHRGAFMEIFVRAWRDADGDGTGDLRGLIAGLPYLQELGMRGLWLMPVFPCADHQHGYAVTDFRAINPEYGTLADFDELLAQAHARGIGIVLDYLVNHSASTHPLFEASRATRDDNPWRDWYVWRDEAPAGWRIYGHDPWWRDASGYYFGAFSPQMPDFNWRHPAVTEWHHDNLRFWLNRGVDGFRFDACGHLVENGPHAWNLQPENYRIVADLRRLLDGYQHRFMVCEAPGDPAGFARAGGSAFAFDINKSLVDAAGGDPAALAKVARHFEQAPPMISTMLSNHDAFAGPRVHDQLAGDPGALRRAATLLLTLPGTPFIYYGEEVGMAGDPRLRPDPSVRTPMRWDLAATQRDDERSLLRFYRRLLALRNGRVSLREGSYRVDRLEDGVFAFRRRWQDEETLVVVGASAAGQPLAAPLLVDREARLAVYAV